MVLRIEVDTVRSIVVGLLRSRKFVAVCMALAVATVLAVTRVIEPRDMGTIVTTLTIALVAAIAGEDGLRKAGESMRPPASSTPPPSIPRAPSVPDTGERGSEEYEPRSARHDEVTPVSGKWPKGE